MLLGVAIWDVGRRVDGQALLGGEQQAVDDNLALVVELVPDGERNAEETLSRDVPVSCQPFHPGFVAGPHVLGVPLQFAASGEERLAAVEGSHIPLRGRDDLERAPAPLVVLDRMGDRTRLTEQVAGLAQELHDPRLGTLDRQALDLRVARVRSPGVDGLPTGRSEWCRSQAAIPSYHRARRQSEVAPPGHVRQVAERADHRDARPLVRLCELVGENWDGYAEQRGQHFGTEQALVALIGRMGDERDTGRHQLRSSRLDLDGMAVIRGPHEAEPMVEARVLFVDQLGLGNRGLEVDVPQRRSLLPVGLIACQEAEETALRSSPRYLADRRVVLGPVDRGSELAEQPLKGLLVLSYEDVAQLDEVRARYRDRTCALLAFVLQRRRDEVRVVRQGRVATDPEVVLDAALGGQAVVVPADRVEDRLAGHPLVAGDNVGLGIGEHVTDVKRA